MPCWASRPGPTATSISWWTLEPDPKLVKVEFDNNDPHRHVSASRSPSTKEAIVYMPKGGAVTLAADQLQRGFVAEWIDPRTGKRSKAKGAAGHRYASPDARDWVLVLR